METFQQIWDALRAGTLPDLGFWSYILLVVLVFLEGPAATLVAGAMAAAGILRFDLVFLFAAIANFLADAFWYALGYFGGNRTLLYRFRWFRRRQRQIVRMENTMQGQGVKMYFMTKLSLGLMTIPILVAAGLARVAWYRMIVVSLIVEPLWTLLLVFAGYRLGDYIARLERGLQIGAIVGTVIVLLVFISMYRRMFGRIAHMDDLRL